MNHQVMCLGEVVEYEGDDPRAWVEEQVVAQARVAGFRQPSYEVLAHLRAQWSIDGAPLDGSHAVEHAGSPE